MKIYELAIVGNTTSIKNPDISFVKNENGDILKNFINFLSTSDKIYIDYNIINNLTLLHRFNNENSNNTVSIINHYHSYTNNVDMKLHVSDLKVNGINGSLIINRSNMTTLPNISIDENYINDDELISIVIDNSRFSIVKTYNDSFETIMTRYSKIDNSLSAVMKFNTTDNIVTRSITLYLFDKEIKEFVKFSALFNKKNNTISFNLSKYDDSENGYSKLVESYKPERLTSFKLKFNTISTKYIIYNPSKIDKDTLMRKVQSQSNFTPILISWETLGTIEGLMNFLDISLASRNVRSITLVGMDMTIPFYVFKNMKNVFFEKEDGKLICVKSS